MPQGESAGKLTKRVREAIESAYGLQLAQLTQILVENDLESPTISTKADIFELAQLYVSKGPRPLASLLTCLLERRQDHALLKQALEHVDSLPVAPTGPADLGNVAPSSSPVSEFRRRLLTAPNSERELRSLEYEVEAYLNSEPGDYEARLLLDDVRSARGFAAPTRSARQRSMRWVFSVAAASLLIASASLTFYQYKTWSPVASPVIEEISEGLVLEDLRPPDDESDQGREERSFAASIRFVGPGLTHVVTRTSAGQELVIKGYSLQGTIEGDILAVRDGKYASLETFAKSAEKSFEKGQGLVLPPDSQLVLRSLTGDGRLTYQITGYARSAGAGKPALDITFGVKRRDLTN